MEFKIGDVVRYMRFDRFFRKYNPYIVYSINNDIIRVVSLKHEYIWVSFKEEDLEKEKVK